MINQAWTLFLDRDGVLNEKLPGDYVKCVEELVLKPDVVPALKRFREHFGRIIIVTNQQGIEKGVMREEDLHVVHQHLKEQLRKEGVAIDAIYYCRHLAEKGCECRKPNIGMAQQAQRQFPEIDFKQSLMVGDSLSDILFGKRCGMLTALIRSAFLPAEIATEMMPDYLCDDLSELAELIL